MDIKKLFFQTTLIMVLFLTQSISTQAAFPYISQGGITDTTTITDTLHANESKFSLANFPRKIKRSVENKHSFKNGFAAYLSIGLGVVGLIFFGLQTTALMMLFGIAAGVAGKVGLNRYKHDKFLKTLCYIGIGLGALLVIFATIPILFLL